MKNIALALSLAAAITISACQGLSSNGSAPKTKTPQQSLENFSFSEEAKVDNFYLGEIVMQGESSGMEYIMYSQFRLFEIFWHEVMQDKTLPLDEKTDLWMKTIYEKVGRDFFEKFAIIELGTGEEFDKAYREIIKRDLEPFLDKEHFENVKALNEMIEQNIEVEVVKSIDYFGRFSEDVKIIIFNSGVGGATARNIQNDRNKSAINLVVNNAYKFFTDYLGEAPNQQNVKKLLEDTIPHETGHLYHFTNQPDTAQTHGELFKESKNFALLYAEGIGNYFEAKINNKDDNDYSALMGIDYGNVTKEDIRILAAEFLKFYDKKAKDDDFETWGKWQDSNEPINGKVYPSGIGYFLGYWVVKDAIERRGVDLKEYLSHGDNDDYVKQQVFESLKYLSEQ